MASFALEIPKTKVLSLPFPGGSGEGEVKVVKNPPAMQETWVRSLSWGDPLEEGMATHSNILAWRMPMDRGAWQATVHGVAKSQTQLSELAHTRIHFSSRKGRCNQSLILLSNCSFYSYILVV